MCTIEKPKLIKLEKKKQTYWNLKKKGVEEIKDKRSDVKYTCV